MVKTKRDLTGQIFGRLKVIEQVEDFIEPNGTHCAQWLCECNCEKHTILKVKGVSLTRTDRPTMSCGCISREKTIARNINSCKLNKYDLSGEYGIGWTNNTNKEFYFDLGDYDVIKDYCWYEYRYNDRTCSLRAHKKGYKTYITMHDLLGYKDHDHVDRNPLNNRRNNLRVCTKDENSYNGVLQKNNKSGFTGVIFNKKLNKWAAYIRYNGKQIHLGYFINKEDAIKIRLKAEKEYFGEFAPQIFLFEQYGIFT